VLEALLGEKLEELRVLRIRAREAGFDEVQAEAVETLGDAELLSRLKRYALSLHTVAESGVVEVDLPGHSPFLAVGCLDGSGVRRAKLLSGAPRS
jgi:hypothetical protein